MILKSYFRPLIEYWWLILVAALVAVSTSSIVTFFQSPIYQTKATLMVGRMMYEANPTSNDIYLGEQLANYYAEIGNRDDVSNSTQKALGLNWLPEYTISPLPNSQLLEIVVSDSNPARAQAVANELANQLILRSPTSNQQQTSDQQAFINEQVSYLEEKVRETLTEINDAEKKLSEANSAQQIAVAQNEISALQDKLSQMQSNYAALISNTGQGAVNTLSVIERAYLPISPTGPNKLITIIMAGLIASVIAAAAAYLLEYLDDTVKTEEDITNILTVPVLGHISIISNEINESKPVQTNSVQAIIQRIKEVLRIGNKQNNETELDDDDVFIYSANNPRSFASEEFRSLRLNLDFASVAKPLRTILITSPSPSEGKSSVASNLAIVMAQGGKKVILLDVDFRKPKNLTHFYIPNDKGLSDVLRGSLELKNVMQSWKENLYIISAGVTPPNPVDLLSSQRMSQVLEELESISDVVIIDAPPLIFPDSLALSPKADGVMVVFRYAFTRRGLAQAQVDQLTKVGARVVGIVLNQTPIQQVSYYDKYRY